jgi:hypothetical protein
MPVAIGAVVLLQIACAVHCVRNGRSGMWLTVILIFPGLGSLAYVVTEILPSYSGHRQVRMAKAAVVGRIDPDRDLRAARDAIDTADTAANRIAYGDALAEQEKWREAAEQYGEALARMTHEDRPTQLKLARVRLEGGDHREARRLLKALPPSLATAENDRASLLLARALAESGETVKALAMFEDVGQRMPGAEAQCRQAGLLIELGREREAVAPLEETERRARKVDRWERARQRDMYDWAARTLADLRERGIALR